MFGLRYLRNVATLVLDESKCNGCGMCVTVCPQEVLTLEERRAHIVDRDGCMECGACTTARAERLRCGRASAAWRQSSAALWRARSPPAVAPRDRRVAGKNARRIESGVSLAAAPLADGGSGVLIAAVRGGGGRAAVGDGFTGLGRIAIMSPCVQQVSSSKCGRRIASDCCTAGP